MSVEIFPNTLCQLNKSLQGQVHFSDVFTETAELEEPDPWRKTDFDAGLTVNVESAGFPKLMEVPIGVRSWMTNYGLVVVDDLLQSRHDRVDTYLRSQTFHADSENELYVDKNQAVAAVANYAPRDDANIAGGHNGSDFYLAITQSSLEVYATPLRFLQDLDDANRITSLFRIPTAGHPEFNGVHEQFRSARVVRTRRHPNHLEPIFQYATQAALIAAKEDGTHPDIIPKDSRSGRIAFIDKFGNVRTQLKDRKSVNELAIGDTARLHVTSCGNYQGNIEVQKAEDLKSAPLGKLAIYANCSDQVNATGTGGLVELIVRVNDNPSTSRGTAIYKLLEVFTNLDPATAELKIEI